MSPSPSTQPSLKVETYIENVYDGKSAIDECLMSIDWGGWFQIWLEALYPNIPTAATYELSLRLTSDRQIQTFNCQYRQRNQPTDVLAFAALETTMPQPAEQSYAFEPLYLGDLIISLDTALRQAQEQAHSLTTELAWLSSHGLLHLLGWDHPNDESLVKMLAQQTKLLQYAGIFQ